MSDFSKIRKTIRNLKKSYGSPAGRRSRATPAKILRTRVWLESIFMDHRLSRSEFEKLYYNGDESSGIVLKWLKGEHVANQSTAKRVERLLGYSNNIEVYSIPIFELLETDIQRTTINRIISRFTTKNDASLFSTEWEFKGSSRFPVLNRGVNLLRNYTEGLFQKGGVHGFLGLLALLREAELDGDSYTHLEVMKDVYRAFPSFCRNPYFKKRWKDTLQLLVRIQGMMITTGQLIRPDPNIIRKQIFAKRHPTRRLDWPISPLDGRHLPPELPYVLAKLPNVELTNKTRFK